MKRLMLAGAVLLVAACSSEQSSTADTGAETTDSIAADTTLPANTTTPPATDPPTTVADTTTTTACPVVGDTEPKASDDPLLMSSMVGDDIRAGAHPCFERIVIELGGEGEFPGWNAQYVDDPVQLGPSDLFVEIAGEATLQVTMRVWMPSMEGDGYDGPIQFVPDNVFHILEIRETENFEGVCTWSIGLDAEYPFTVDILHDPERLVVDFRSQWKGRS